MIRTDSGRLEQIVNNLLGNAFKFTRSGRVDVRIGRPALGLPLPEHLSRDNSVAISVNDTGIGIPEDKFHKLFQNFQQIDAGTSRQFGGTGLGLSIARGMARRLGGDIVMQSVFGQRQLVHRGDADGTCRPSCRTRTRPTSRHRAWRCRGQGLAVRRPPPRCPRRRWACCRRRPSPTTGSCSSPTTR